MSGPRAVPATTAVPVVWQFHSYRGPGDGQDKLLHDKSVLARIVRAVQADIRRAIPYVQTASPRVRLVTWEQACNRSKPMDVEWYNRVIATWNTVVDTADAAAYAANGRHFVLTLPRVPSLEAAPFIVLATFPMPVTPALCAELTAMAVEAATRTTAAA